MAQKLNAFWITLTGGGHTRTILRRLPDGTAEDAIAEGAACAHRSNIHPFTVRVEEAEIRRYAVKMQLPNDSIWCCTFYAYDENHLQLKVIAAGRAQHGLAPKDVRYNYQEIYAEAEQE